MDWRLWPKTGLNATPKVKAFIIGYLLCGMILLTFSVFAFLKVTLYTPDMPVWSYLAAALPLCMGIQMAIGVGLLFLFIRKCHHCRSVLGQEISAALKKMSRGDLGWKVTLHRDAELSDVAQSATQASESLADMISKLQIQSQRLTEIEDYLVDSLEVSTIKNPYTLKALRKLKICTSRLNSNLQDFRVSAIANENDTIPRDIGVPEMTADDSPITEDIYAPR